LLQYGTVLGRGACKTVYKAFDLEDGIEVAWNQVGEVHHTWHTQTLMWKKGHGAN